MNGQVGCFHGREIRERRGRTPTQRLLGSSVGKHLDSTIVLCPDTIESNPEEFRMLSSLMRKVSVSSPSATPTN